MFNNATSALTYTRDPHHRWITNTLLSGQLAPPQVENVAASYDAVGNLTRTVDTQGPAGSPTQTTCYQYDDLQQLKDAWSATDDCATAPQPSVIGGVDPFWESWTYDAAGSRETQTLHTLPGQSGDDAVTTYTNGVSGHAHALASAATTGTTTPQSTGVKVALPSTKSVTYTPSGATDTLTTPDGSTKFTYRNDGSIATVTMPDGGTSEFVNDPDGNRLLRIDRKAGTTDTTLYLPGEQLRLTDNGTTKTLTTNRYYTLASGQLIASRKNTANPVFTLTDPHGTAQLTYDPYTNTTNPPIQRRAIDPYGNELSQDEGTTPWIDDRTFLNKPLNPVTGLVDLGARQYDATTGRFTSVDPLLDLADPLQANGYNYANNNPLSYSDPTGTAPACGGELCPGAKPKPDGTWDMSGVSQAQSAERTREAIARTSKSIKACGIRCGLSIGIHRLGKEFDEGTEIDGHPITPCWGKTGCSAPIIPDENGDPDPSATLKAVGLGAAVGIAALGALACVADPPACAAVALESVPGAENAAAGAGTGIGFAGLTRLFRREVPAPVVRNGDHIVLGLRSHGLEETADKVGGRTLLKDDRWMATIERGVADPSTKFTVSLDGMDGSSVYQQVMGAAMRGASRSPRATDWEMAKLFEGGRLPDVNFVRGGHPVENPWAQ